MQEMIFGEKPLVPLADGETENGFGSAPKVRHPLCLGNGKNPVRRGYFSRYSAESQVMSANPSNVGLTPQTLAQKKTSGKAA